jgi:uncharacterized membrane protein
MISIWTNSTWLMEFGSDLIAVLLSALMIGMYYFMLLRRTRQNPNYSIIAVNALARRLWVKNVMTNPGKELIAVQSLRNFIMVGIMMASTASLLIMGTLTLSGQAKNITQSWHILGLYGSHAPELWIVKVMCLLADFLLAFFAYAMAIRLANQVLFMLNVPIQDQADNAILSYENVATRLNQAGQMIAIGMRTFFFAIPLVFWLFGPIFLFIATLGLVVTLHHLDRHQSGL